MRVTWDEAKNLTNKSNHGLSFEEAAELFASGVDFLELFDDAHSELGDQARASALLLLSGAKAMTDIPELTAEQFERAIPASLRQRWIQGQIKAGEEIAALRRFIGLTQKQFAQAMGISVHTLRNWEQGRREPEGPAIALLRIAARHPRILRENLQAAA